MATYPIKMLKDEHGQLFIPLTNSDSVVTTTGDTLEELIDAKVDKVTGKGLSTNDYTTTEKQKLAGLENYNLPKASSSTLGGIKVGTNLSIDSNGVLSADAQHIDVDSALSGTSENPVQNKIIKNALDDKVDIVSGKGLSTNDYTTDEKNKLAGIAEGAEVNQNAFSNVKVGTTTIAADSKTDTLTLAAGDNITLTPNATSDTVTITATDTTYTAATTAPGNVASSSSVGTSTNYARQDHTHGIDLATGDANGQVKIAGINVSVKGLGSAAYTASTAYATAAQGTLAANAIPSSQKGVANGVAELDANGLVPSSQLPSYVDDVLEYAQKSNFPTTGETGKIYISQNDNKTYRWSGTTYVEISTSLALGTTSSTAFRGDYGNTAYTHAVTNKGSAFASGLYKITTNAEGHVTGAVAVEKADITALGIPSTNITYESKTAISGGTDVSLVTTGEKYIWNNKQDALTTQTAYNAKGTATKVPQITTNTLGQVTKIEEVTITQPTKTSDLTNDSGFITSYTETDPIFSASAAADITATDIDNWNAKVSDDKTWNGVSLAKQSTTNSGDSTYVPLATSTTPVNMSFTPVKKTPTNNAIAKYDNSAYLYSTTPSSNDNSTKVATTAYVDTAIDTLPEPMVFKGSLGTGGTITTLPDASSTNEGFTYKVITAGTYASQAAKIGDTFISDGSSWVLIPSGDEPSGTVTSITLKATSPIAIDSSSAITTSGTRTISHSNSGVTAGTYRSVTVNETGHVTAGTNPTTLSGYGITDAKIASGTITLGSNTITPLTASSTLDATKLSGTIPSSCYTVPTKTSELTNDSDFITDTNYTHTDNNYTDAEVTKLAGIEEGATVDDKTWNGVTLKAGTTLGSSTNYVPAKSNTTVGSGDAYYLPMSATPTANYGVKYTSSAMLQSTTPSIGTNSTIVATTAFVQSTISALTFANKFSTTITGDGSKTSFSVDHNLNTRDVIVQLYDTSTFETVIVNTVRASNNTITLTFKTAPTSSESYKVIVLG